ncbi:MAG: endolytic transglycosylase MltG [Acidimicrobiia bacterium]|nr:MAG: endolytic transglycosylase MltG [Acidimicrobiia bacterium]
MPKQEITETPGPEASPVRRWLLVGLLGIAAVLVLFLGARFAAGLVAGDSWSVEGGQPVEVTIESGSSASSIYVTLNDAGVARANQLRDAARRAGVEDQLRAGTYAFTTDMDPDEAIRMLVLGSPLASGTTFTVIEGWTINRILDELEIQTEFTRSDFERALTSGAVTSPLLPPISDDVDEIRRWEGLLYPAKYPITADATPESILSPMASEMTTRLRSIDWSRSESLSIGRYDALIIASLIEREARIDADRRLISSVIHNRLAADMRLQIDATIVYALEGVDGQVTAEDLKVESPYNTYRIDGLPPTPIGTMSVTSIEAAVNPASTDYLFYVLADKDGTHAFATTYEEHQENVRAAKEAGVLP